MPTTYHTCTTDEVPYTYYRRSGQRRIACASNHSLGFVHATVYNIHHPRESTPHAPLGPRAFVKVANNAAVYTRLREGFRGVLTLYYPSLGLFDASEGRNRAPRERQGTGPLFFSSYRHPLSPPMPLPPSFSWVLCPSHSSSPTHASERVVQNFEPVLYCTRETRYQT